MEMEDGMIPATETSLRTHRPSWIVRIENFAPNGDAGKCRVTFIDIETSSVIASRSLDCRLVNRLSIRELANLMNANYRSEVQRVAQLSGALQLISNRAIRRVRIAKWVNSHAIASIRDKDRLSRIRP